MEKDPEWVLKNIDVYTDLKDPNYGKHDPPPPEPEDGDESGGTGTAMALEEGKMGKQDAPAEPRTASAQASTCRRARPRPAAR